MTALLARPLQALRPIPTPEDQAELAIVQRDRRRSAVAWLVAGAASSHLAVLALMLARDEWWWGAPGIVAALWMLGIGTAQLLLVARADRSQLPNVLGTLAAVAVGVLLSPLGGIIMLVLGPAHLLLPLAAGAFGLVLLCLDPTMRAAAPRPVGAAVLGAAIAIACIGGVVLHVLVLLPMGWVPGMPLDEIQRELSAAGEDNGPGMLWVWVAAAAVGVLLLAAGAVRSRRPARQALGWLLLAAIAAITALPVLTFGVGMSLGDTFMHAPGPELGAIGLLLVAELLVAWASWLLLGARREGEAGLSGSLPAAS